MAGINDAWAEHQRRRWIRPNAHLHVRPDAYRFMPPSAPRLVGKDAVHYFWPAAPIGEAQAQLNWKYSPDQPRAPAGTREGGQWTSGQTVVSFPSGPVDGDGEQEDLVQLAQFDGTVTDAYGVPYYKPGGHHEMPKGVFSNWNLAPETRQIFEQSTTGVLPRQTVRTTPDGTPFGNVWNKAHLEYNDAVRELSDRFFQRSNIKPEQMTPTQAQGLLKEIRESPDSRIRDFNASMRILQRLLPYRGRGSD